MSYIVSTSILGIQTFVTRFDPSGGDSCRLSCRAAAGGGARGARRPARSPAETITVSLPFARAPYAHLDQT